MAVNTFNPPTVKRWRIDTSMPLHRLAAQRMDKGRDLKIIITAKDSQTGVGKTTLAGWLAINWTEMFAEQQWLAAEHATLNPKEYFRIIAKVAPGTVVIVDDAEELDARRSMQHLNVEFSQRWMLMRLKQLITIITLPSPRAIDVRLEELADVWINVERRGRAMVHDIRVNSYGNRNIMTEQKHKIEFPNVADLPEMQALRQMKVDKMDEWDLEEEEEEVPEPEEIERSEKIEIAQRLRDDGMSARDIADYVERSHTWVYNNTEAAE